MSSYFITVPLILRAEFRNSDGDLFDPNTVLLNILPPSGPQASPAAVNDSVGLYSCQYAPELIGLHKFIFIGKDVGGAVIAAQSSTFQVGSLTLSRT